MKSVNRKVLLSLLGIAAATPFLVIALIVGARAAALADGLQGDLLVVVLALASVVAGIGEGRIVLRREGAPAKRRVEANGDVDLRGVRTLTHGY
jgi:hypothetical protein